MNRQLFFYTIILILLVSLIGFVIQEGKELQVGSHELSNQTIQIHSLHKTLPNSAWQIFLDDINTNFHHPVTLMILQIVVIMAVSRFFGLLAVQVKQPSVIGEMIAGIVLGPSLVGEFYPEFSAYLFPKHSLDNLKVLSQVGLILFMFIIGVELDFKVMQNKAHKAFLISHISIAFCYFSGVILAYFLYQDFAPEKASFLEFSLFMGIAMSITAFPVLARIIQERELNKIPLGNIIIACAAVDDITAWCLLAGVITIVKVGDTFLNTFYVVVITVAFVWFMLRVVRPFLGRLSAGYSTKETLNKNVMAFLLLLLLICAFVTEILGIHAFIGAFLAGLCMPDNQRFKEVITNKLEDVSVVLLLPLFFTFTGLRTEIGLLNDVHLWVTAFVVMATAITGKFVGGALTSRLVGMSWQDSLIIGALINTRGLMELIVLNIGYDLGILSRELFAIMVLMALGTTFMTGPALNFLQKIFKMRLPSQTIITATDYNLLLSFGPSQSGSRFLNLASQFTYKDIHLISITALHITPSTQLSQIDAELFEREAFEPIKHTAESIGIPMQTKYKVSEDVGKDIINLTKKGSFDLLLVGATNAQNIYQKVGGIAKYCAENAPCDIAVFIDNKFETAGEILIFLSNEQDLFLLKLAKRFMDNVTHSLAIVYKSDLLPEIVNKITTLKMPARAIELVRLDDFMPVAVENVNLLLFSYDYWHKLCSQQTPWLAENLPPTLVVRKVKNNVEG